jgi:H+/Cl- antiporter ClcA
VAALSFPQCSSAQRSVSAASALPGMNLAAGIGMGIGAMCAAMLRLPLTATLLAVVLMGTDGVLVTPQVVVAVVVAFVITIRVASSRSKDSRTNRSRSGPL